MSLFLVKNVITSVIPPSFHIDKPRHNNSRITLFEFDLEVET